MEKLLVVPTTGQQHQQTCTKIPEQTSAGDTTAEKVDVDLNIINKIERIKVSDYTSFVPELIKYFEHKVNNFSAGKVNLFYHVWRTLTSDSEILETVSGQLIEFTVPPVQQGVPIQPNWSNEKGQFIDSEIDKLLKEELMSRHNGLGMATCCIHKFSWITYVLKIRNV
jgi:hypothetical protein